MGEKTEQATPHRREKAIAEGDAPFSIDAVTLALMGGGVLLMQLLLGPTLFEYFDEFLERAFFAAGLRDDLKADGAQSIAQELILIILICAAGAFVLVMLCCIAGAAIQGALRFSAAKLSIKSENLNPINGAKRIFSMQKLVELVSGLLKLTLTALLTIQTIMIFIGVSSVVSSKNPESFWQFLLNLQLAYFLIFLPFAFGDFLLQRYLFSKRIRMSKEDQKDEHKNLEGNPEVKSERRQINHQWMNEPPPSTAREATFIAANPTHIAVAIRYDENKDQLPVVLLHGAGERALAIFAEARAAKIPIIEDVFLARSLYRRVNQSMMVPEDLLETVAKILVSLTHGKQKEAA